MLSRYQNAAAAPESTQGDFRKEPSWATSVINLVLKILESNKNIQSIISYNTYILLYIYIYTGCPKIGVQTTYYLIEDA
jgi:hypothetical protein